MNTKTPITKVAVPNQIVAYFDFDGTITNHDTLVMFVLYVVGVLKFLFNLHLLLAILLLYYMKIFDNEKAKEAFLTIMFKGLTEDFINNKAKNFATDKLDRQIKSEVYSRLEYHLEHGHRVILVSANLGIYLRYWAKKHKIAAVIATEIEFLNGIASGKLATRNCYGVEKVARIKQYLEEHSLSFLYRYGYGNSRGDYELLSYVDEGYWINGTQITSWEKSRGI